MPSKSSSTITSAQGLLSFRNVFMNASLLKSLQHFASSLERVARTIFATRPTSTPKATTAKVQTKYMKMFSRSRTLGNKSQWSLTGRKQMR